MLISLIVIFGFASSESFLLWQPFSFFLIWNHQPYEDLYRIVHIFYRGEIESFVNIWELETVRSEVGTVWKEYVLLVWV